MTICVLSLALLGGVNYLLERRCLYPPVVFCVVWALDIALVGFSGTIFYSLSDKTLTIFCGGAITFSVGAALALFATQSRRREQPSTQIPGKALNVLFWLVLLSAPFTCLYIIQIASSFKAATMLLAARMAMLDAY